MKKFLFQNYNDWTGLLLRLTLGIVLFPHGAQKMFGWFEGYGFNNTVNYFTSHLGLPKIVAISIILIEFVGSLSLILGFAGRLWSLAIIGLMTGIILTAHIQNGFFMDWNNTNAGEGFEYHLLVIGIAVAILINGSGKWSLDSHIYQKLSDSSLKK